MCHKYFLYIYRIIRILLPATCELAVPYFRRVIAPRLPLLLLFIATI